MRACLCLVRKKDFFLLGVKKTLGDCIGVVHGGELVGLMVGNALLGPWPQHFL